MKQSGEIDTSGIKRCYVDGLIIKTKCPKCKTEIRCNFSDYYLSYPSVGSDETAYFYCEPCESEFELLVKVTKTELEIEYEVENIHEI